jgi:hypothetical protein
LHHVFRNAFGINTHLLLEADWRQANVRYEQEADVVTAHLNRDVFNAALRKNFVFKTFCRHFLSPGPGYWIA